MSYIRNVFLAVCISLSRAHVVHVLYEIGQFFFLMGKIISSKSKFLIVETLFSSLEDGIT